MKNIKEKLSSEQIENFFSNPKNVKYFLSLVGEEITEEDEKELGPASEEQPIEEMFKNMTVSDFEEVVGCSFDKFLKKPL